jgi:hypothetical protein
MTGTCPDWVLIRFPIAAVPARAKSYAGLGEPASQELVMPGEDRVYARPVAWATDTGWPRR